MANDDEPADHGDGDEGIKDGPLSASERRRLRRLMRETLSPIERQRLRRMLEEHDRDRIIADHRQTTVKIWLVWIGAVSAILVSGKTLFWDYVKTFLK
jgi:hypothetical protein